MPLVMLARPMQLAKRALKILNFALVIDLLSLGELQRLEHFLHFIQGMLEFLNDPVYLLDGAGDGGRLVGSFFFRLLARLGPALLGFFDRRLGGFRRSGRCAFGLRRYGTARLAPARTASASTSGTTPASRCGICWLF
jgi:hypothetical protein